MQRYEITYRDEANEDIDYAKDWYEIRQEGLGEKFYEKIIETEKHLSKHPKINRIRYNNIRKINLKPYDYSLYYIINEPQCEIQIIAVVHDSRHEYVWKQRVI